MEVRQVQCGERTLRLGITVSSRQISKKHIKLITSKSIIRFDGEPFRRLTKKLARYCDLGSGFLEYVWANLNGWTMKCTTTNCFSWQDAVQEHRKVWCARIWYYVKRHRWNVIQILNPSSTQAGKNVGRVEVRNGWSRGHEAAEPWSDSVCNMNKQTSSSYHSRHMHIALLQSSVLSFTH